MPNWHRCQRCGQPMPMYGRVGIYLPTLKAKIFDALSAAADNGMRTDEIGPAIGRPDMSRNCAHQHIYQLRDRLEETDWDIVNIGRSKNALWFLRKRTRREAAE